MNFVNRLGLTFFVLSLGNTATVAKARRPNFILTSLAGISLSDQRNFIGFDSKERYYLISSLDGLGRQTQIRLLLCPNPKQYGYDLNDPDDGDTTALGPLRRATLPRLRMGRGVNIGETPLQVRHKLGTPQEQYSSRTGTRLYVYRANVVLPLTVEGRRVRWNYKAHYTFRQEHLWAIEYLAEDPDVQ